MVALLSVQVFADSPLHDHEVMRFREAISEHMPGYKQELDTEWDAIVIFKKASEWSYNPDLAPQEVKKILSDWQNCAQRYLAHLIAGMLLGNGFKNGVVKADLNNYERNTYYNSVKEISNNVAFDSDMKVDYLYSSAQEALLKEHASEVNKLFRGKQRDYTINFERQMDIANKCNNICSNIVNKPLQNQARLAVQATPSEFKLDMACIFSDHLSQIEDNNLRERAIADVFKILFLKPYRIESTAEAWLEISKIEDELARNTMAEIYESGSTEDSVSDKGNVLRKFWNTPDDQKMHMIDDIISNHPLYNSFKDYLQEIELGVEYNKIDKLLLTRARTAVDSAPLKAKEQVARAWMIFCLRLN